MIKKNKQKTTIKKQNKWKTQSSSNNMTPLAQHQSNIQKPIIKKLGKYEFSLNQKIGSGMSGDVYIGINTQSKQVVCIKIIDRQSFLNEKQKMLLNDQIRCQSLIKCQFIVKILDVFDTDSFSFIVTQFCDGGDLYKLIKFTENGIQQNLVRHFGFQIANALYVMKTAKIIHRDIKSENIMIKKGITKLGDFGFAIQQKKLTSIEPFNLGSPLYMSLQALEENLYTYASDIFSFGIVLYEMLHRITPWFCNDETQLKKKIKTQSICFKNDLSQDLKDLIQKSLQIDPSKRITIEEVLQHRFFYDKYQKQQNQLKQLSQEKQKNNSNQFNQ